jgi:hypothetical protein
MERAAIAKVDNLSDIENGMENNKGFHRSQNDIT